MLTISKIEALLKARFDAVFGKNPISEGFNEHVWSDGGEWPVLRKVKKFANVRSDNFAWPIQSKTCHDSSAAADYIVTSLSKSSIASISMKCGAGKSTELIVQLLNRGAFSNIVCIEPGFIVADNLATYVTSQYSSVLVTRKYIRNERSICYMSAGEFVTQLYNNVTFNDSLVIIDEMDATNAIYAALPMLLNLIKSPVLGMTASSEVAALSRNKVTSQSYATLNEKFINVIKESETNKIEGKTLIIGTINSPIVISKAANHLIGLTLDINTVIDISNRLDPILVDNKIVSTYRSASSLEKTQTLGRLSRTNGSTGKFHYILGSNVYTIPGRPKLYSLIFDALLTAFGLGGDMRSDEMYKILTCNNVRIHQVNYDAQASSSRIFNDNLSSSSSTHTKSSLRSHKSALRTPRSDEIQKVTNASYGYMVDNVPKSNYKNWTTVRASTWVSCLPNKNLRTVDRQTNFANDMTQSLNEIEPNPTDYKHLDFESVKPLPPTDATAINDILAGKAFPQYTSEELEMVVTAWTYHLKVNGKVPVNINLEENVRKYYLAYNNANKKS